MTKQKITELTPAQEQALIDFRDEWMAIGLQSGAADMAVVRPVIESIYRQAGLQPPQFFIQCPSPYWVQIAINLLKTGAQVRAQVWAQVRAQVGAQRLEYFGTSLWGAGDSHWIAYALFFQHQLKSDFYTSELQAHLAEWETLARGCYWWYPFEHFCFVCDRPETHFDNDKRLHNASGPSIAFSDGFSTYHWHGVRVPEHVILRPETITVAEIEAERNAEVRRVMIDRMTVDKFMAQIQPTLVHEIAEFGVRRHPVKLYRWRSQQGDEIYAVCVKNTTPESDGTFKDYFIEVDHTAYNGDAGRNAHAAVASTWRRKLPDGTGGEPYFRDWRQYAPDAES